MSDHDQRRHDDKPVAQTPSLDPDGRARSLRSTLIIRGFWIVVILILIQIDGSLNEPLQKFYDMLGGDIRREIKAYSQFGGFTSVVLIGLVMILMDRPKVSRVWDLALIDWERSTGEVWQSRFGRRLSQRMSGPLAAASR